MQLSLMDNSFGLKRIRSSAYPMESFHDAEVRSEELLGWLQTANTVRWGFSKKMLHK